jgi:hypothetical protein
MRALAVAVVVILVLVAGIMDYVNRNDTPAPLERNVRLWEEAWNKGNYDVPDCAKSWPPTCPDSQETRKVPECAQVWPTTCREDER